MIVRLPARGWLASVLCPVTAGLVLALGRPWAAGAVLLCGLVLAVVLAVRTTRLRSAGLRDWAGRAGFAWTPGGADPASPGVPPLDHAGTAHDVVEGAWRGRVVRAWQHTHTQRRDEEDADTERVVDVAVAHVTADVPGIALDPAGPWWAPPSRPGFEARWRVVGGDTGAVPEALRSRLLAPDAARTRVRCVPPGRPGAGVTVVRGRAWTAATLPAGLDLACDVADLLEGGPR